MDGMERRRWGNAISLPGLLHKMCTEMFFLKKFFLLLFSHSRCLAMPRKNALLLVVSLLAIVYFQSSLSKNRQRDSSSSRSSSDRINVVPRMRRDTSSAALSPSFRASSFNSVSRHQQQASCRRIKKATTYGDFNGRNSLYSTKKAPLPMM